MAHSNPVTRVGTQNKDFNTVGKISVCGIGYQTPISWSKMRLSSFRQAELQCVWIWVTFYGNDDLISNPVSWNIEINVSFVFSS